MPRPPSKLVAGRPSSSGPARSRGALASGTKPRSQRGAKIEIVTSIDRAARVLLAFTQSWDFLTLAEVAQRSGLSKATAFRILSTLTEEGLLYQNAANGAYGLGALSLRLADVILSDMNIYDRARAAMRQIRGRVNETVVLSVREGPFCYHVDSFESTQSISHSQSIGVPFPLHAVLPGRVMLANQPDAAIQDYLKSRGLAGRAAARVIWTDIKNIRRQGHAVSAGNAAGGGNGVAIAISDEQDATSFALHIAVPRGRYTANLEKRCIDALQDAAARLKATAPI